MLNGFGGKVEFEVVRLEKGFEFGDPIGGDLVPKILSPISGEGRDVDDWTGSSLSSGWDSCRDCDVLTPLMALTLPSFFLHVFDLQAKI